MIQNGEKELLDFLSDIDALLEEHGLQNKVTIYLFGGAAAVVGYGSRRGTADIDAVCDDLEAEATILEKAGKGSALERRHGLYLQRANTELMLIEDPEWRHRSVPILSGKLRNLEMFALSREDLILSKLSRFNDRDRQDIQHLIVSQKIEADKLTAYYRSARDYFVGDLDRLDSTFNFVLQEYFQIGPLTF